MKRIKIAIICLAMIVLVVLFGAFLLMDSTPTYHSRDWDGDDSRCLAQLAMCEARWMDIEDKILLINIAVNRVWSEDYPDTIEAVIDDMTDGRYADMEPDYECLDAEHHVQIDGWDLSDGATEYTIENGEIICDGKSR